MRIKCHWCGERDSREFTYYGDASVQRPKEDSPLQDHIEYVYMRDNPCGDHLEYWQHTGGCRAWVKVLRNTRTHEIKKTGLPVQKLKSKSENENAKK